MIPKEGNDLIELHMQNARETEQEEFAEKSLGHVEAILAYALACNHITCIEHGNHLVLLKLIRAQRKNRADQLKLVRKPVKWPEPKDDGAYRFDPMSGTFQN